MLDFFFKALNELELGVWSWINDIVITQHSQKLGYSKRAWIEIWSEIIAKSYNLRRSESIGHGNWRTCHHVWINNRLATWFQVSVTRYMMSYSSTTAAFFHIASSCHVIWNYRKGGSILHSMLLSCWNSQKEWCMEAERTKGLSEQYSNWI